ncbi:sensor histidine kinase [Plantactinospora veratri]
MAGAGVPGQHPTGGARRRGAAGAARPALALSARPGYRDHRPATRHAGAAAAARCGAGRRARAAGGAAAGRAGATPAAPRRHPAGPLRAPSSPAADPWSWLLTRYAEPATWLALLHAGLLGTVGLLLSATGLVLLLLVVVLIASPLLVQTGDGPISIGLARVDTVPQAVPYALLGLVLLAVSPYPLALLAAGQGALARVLLGGGTGERLRTELVQVARSRARLVDAFEAERRRIERDLHDGAQQRLVSLTLQLGLARLEIPPGTPGAAAVADAHEQAKLFMTELRELIRNIHPKVLTDRGLPAAVRDLADSSAVPVTVEVELPGRLPNPVEGTAYFVVAEALTNVAKHAGATAATVSLRLRADRLTIEVADDGRGGADPVLGSGLTGLADRVAGVDGRMLLSSPPGGPTLLRVELPCRPTES